MKKIFSIFLLVAVMFLFSGITLAATDYKLTKSSVDYTDQQKVCIKEAQAKMVQATKPAMEVFNSATNGVLEIRQAAIQKAQAIKDEKARAVAIKEAMDAYNNDASVETARVPYMAAIKVANDQFQLDKKACLTGNKVVGFFQNIFMNISASLSNSVTSKNSSVVKKAPTTPVKYTDEQKACIKAAQDKRATAMKPAIDAIKSQTEAALKVRQEAITVAQKIKDVKARAAAIKKANDIYNNDKTVQQSRPAYITAVKAANDQFQVDQKSCLSGSGISPKGFFKKIGDSFSNFGLGLAKFFTGKK